MKKIISLILVVLSLFSFTACANNNNNNQGGPGSNQPEKVVDEVLTSNYILYNGVTDYKIVISDDASDDENVARDELDSLFYEATGVELPIISDEGLTHNADNKYICIGDNDLFRSANIDIPESAKGNHGYYIYTKDNTIYIIGQEKYGNRFGMYTFLFRILNFEQYSYDCYWIDTAVTDIPLYNYTIAHSPHYDTYRVFAAFLRSYNTARYRVYGPETYTSVSGDIYGKSGHNTLLLMQKDKNFEEHPKWFAYPSPVQLCFMAQGDEAERELMVETAAANLIENMKQMPDRTVWCISNEDVNVVCGCDTCNELKEIFNGPNAQYIWFLNDVRDKVFEYFETEEGSALFDEYYQKNFTIESSFYWAYISVPAVKDAKTGQFKPIENDDYPSVMMKENTRAHCAPISSAFQRSFHDELNSVYYDQLRAITAISPQGLGLWMYSANFHSYMYPYDCFSAMQENYQIWHNEFGVTDMLDECQNGNYLGMPGWQMLTAVLSSRLAHDIYLDQEAFIQRYFRGYFLDGANAMMKYFDSMRSHTMLLLEQNPKMGDCYYNIRQKQFWPKALIDEWSGYVEEALDAIEKYKNTDSDKYDMLYRHITLERVFLDYVYLYFYSSNIGSRYSEIATRFVQDCNNHKITHTAEGTYITSFLDNILSEM